MNNTTKPSDVLILEVTGDKVNLRSGPGKEHSAIMQVQRSSRLTVEDRSGDWYRVFSPTGTRAFVHSDFVRALNNVTPAQNQPVQTLVQSPFGQKPKRAGARASSAEKLVSFGKMKIGGRSNSNEDIESLAMRRLKERLGAGMAQAQGTN